MSEVKSSIFFCCCSKTKMRSFWDKFVLLASPWSLRFVANYNSLILRSTWFDSVFCFEFDWSIFLASSVNAFVIACFSCSIFVVRFRNFQLSSEFATWLIPQVGSRNLEAWWRLLCIIQSCCWSDLGRGCYQSILAYLYEYCACFGVPPNPASFNFLRKVNST